jgi:hypothetical protein
VLMRSRITWDRLRSSWVIYVCWLRLGIDTECIYYTGYLDKCQLTKLIWRKSG